MIRAILEQNGFLIRENVWGYEEENDFFEIVAPEQMKKYNEIFKDRKGRMNEHYLFIGAYRLPNNLEYHIYDFDEFVCRQYVKENGFKLEWLKKVLKDSELELEITKCNNWFVCEVRDIIFDKLHYMFEYNNYGKNKINVVSGRLMNPFKHMKLIAWLYANDIKVVE